MSDLIQGNSQSQNQNTQTRLSADHIQFQKLVIASTHELDQIVHQKLATNPALELNEEPDFCEEVRDDHGDQENWAQDFDKPYDEYESGEPLASHADYNGYNDDIYSRLEQAALEYTENGMKSSPEFFQNIDYCRTTGSLPVNESEKLKNDLQILEKSLSQKLQFIDSPIFKAYDENDSINVLLLPTIADSLTFRKGFGKYSLKAEKFINNCVNRAVNLNNLANTLLLNIQGDFFRRAEFKEALLALTPISSKNLQDLDIKFSLTLDKKLISKLSDLTVECKFGIFPLGLFIPSKAALLRLWLNMALPSEISSINDQCEWVKEQVYLRIKCLDPNDMRKNLLEPLLEISANDIKNARKKLKA